MSVVPTGSLNDDDNDNDNIDVVGSIDYEE